MKGSRMDSSVTELRQISEQEERLRLEREEERSILTYGHDSLERVEMDLHRLQNAGRATPEMIQGRYRIREAMMWLKQSGHAGR
jgi:hypothetical protein